MDGIYYKEWSAVLDRAMEFKRYVHSGVPVLALKACNSPLEKAAMTTCRHNRFKLFPAGIEPTTET